MIVLFAGPTLSEADIRAATADAPMPVQVLPPASQGDVYRVVQRAPWGIGIIDGYFERLPAVWHKEILWAMKQGVRVYGAASMGALRAAELDHYGMIGVGSVYEAFRAGALTRDDEVVLLHGPAESGYRPLTEALVDIRATLSDAVKAGVLSREGAMALISLAAQTHYTERRWDALLAQVDPALAEALRAWLPEGRRSTKRADALALVARMLADASAPDAPFQVDWAFHNTVFFQDACQQPGRRPLDDAAIPDELLLDELRLLGPEPFEQALRSGLARALCLEESARLGLAADETLLARAEAQLATQGALEGLSERARARLVAREAEVQRVRQMLLPQLGQHVREQLRVDGQLAALAARAESKLDPVGEGPDADTLLQWYFTERLGVPIPDPLEAWLLRLGVPHREVFLEVLAREYALSQGAPLPPAR